MVHQRRILSYLAFVRAVEISSLRLRLLPSAHRTRAGQADREWAPVCVGVTSAVLYILRERPRSF